MWTAAVCVFVFPFIMEAEVTCLSAPLTPLKPGSLASFRQLFYDAVADKLLDELKEIEEETVEYSALEEQCVDKVEEEGTECVKCLKEYNLLCKIPGFKLVVDIVRDCVKLMKDVLKAIEDRFDDVMDLLQGHAEFFIDGIETIAGHVGTVLEKGYKEIIGGLEDLTEGIQDGLSDLGKGIEHGVKEIGEGLEDTAKALGNGLEDTVKGLGKGIENTVDALGDGIGDVAESLGDVASNVGKVLPRIRLPRIRVGGWKRKRRGLRWECDECEACVPFDEDGNPNKRMICGDDFVDGSDRLKNRIERVNDTIQTLLNNKMTEVLANVEYDGTSLTLNDNFEAQFDTVYVTALIKGKYEQYMASTPYQMMDMATTTDKYAQEYLDKWN